MPEPVKPKTPDPEPIIELIDHIPLGYLLLAFICGAVVVVGIVMIYGNALQGRTEEGQG